MSQTSITLNKSYSVFNDRQRLIYLLIAGIVAMIIANITVDFVQTLFLESSFYMTESVMFSAPFWILFLPLLLIMARVFDAERSRSFSLSVAALTITAHMFSYPAMIWLLSKTFLPQTFTYWLSLNYFLSAYLLKVTIIYGVSLFCFVSNLFKRISTPIEDFNYKKEYITSIIVSDIGSRKIVLSVGEISHFSANPPYVDIHSVYKRFLYSNTLKCLENQLCQDQFVRIHRSSIVNVHKVTFLESRKNGDYDIILSDKTKLRVSRNYAKNFKVIFLKYHQLNLESTPPTIH